MATVQKIYEEMQRMAPLELAESWDNPGLLVDCGGEVSRVLVALDVPAETLASPPSVCTPTWMPPRAASMKCWQASLE